MMDRGDVERLPPRGRGHTAYPSSSSHEAISPTSRSESSATSTRTGGRPLGGGAATIVGPDALTFFALVEGAGVFVSGKHRIGAAAGTFVHN